jgi:hypothetical protein
MTDFRGKRVVHEYKQHNVAPPEKVFPLLCPVREGDWAPGWKYRLILLFQDQMFLVATRLDTVHSLGSAQHLFTPFDQILTDFRARHHVAKGGVVPIGQQNIGDVRELAD